jgi:hypothetical protein
MKIPKNISLDDFRALIVDISRDEMFGKENRSHKALHYTFEYVHKHLYDWPPEVIGAFLPFIAEFLHLLSEHEQWVVGDDNEKEQILSHLH